MIARFEETRCPYCHATYPVPVGATVNTYRTADPPPPADNIVHINGQTIHSCQRGRAEQ